MSNRLHGTAPRVRGPLPFDCVALLLQGGGALGSYQAGVYEALSEAGITPDWVAGISIGAVNAAIIAGNAPEDRVARLDSFWSEISANPFSAMSGELAALAIQGDAARDLFNRLNAAFAAVAGVPGFFAPRPVTPWLMPAGAPGATSLYDTAQLKGTLERLVDFDRINAREMRFSIGAVNVRTGNVVYFDNTTHRIGPEHILASGALPPGFQAVEIEGEHYWDGGLVSNTPLHWVFDQEARRDTLAFQIDLWNARGGPLRTMAEVATRQKEIQYSSRTRADTDRIKQTQRLRCALAALLRNLPEALKSSPEAGMLADYTHAKVCTVVQLIYRSRGYEGESKDYEFSRLSVQEHWRAGYVDAVHTLRHPHALDRPAYAEGVRTFDLAEQDAA
jgi:NTE family protein